MFWVALSAIVLTCVTGIVLALALCRAAALGDRQMCELMDVGGKGKPFYPADAGE